jgi:hypothetical protein
MRATGTVDSRRWPGGSQAQPQKRGIAGRVRPDACRDGIKPDLTGGADADATDQADRQGHRPRAEPRIYYLVFGPDPFAE